MKKEDFYKNVILNSYYYFEMIYTLVTIYFLSQKFNSTSSVCYEISKHCAITVLQNILIVWLLYRKFGIGLDTSKEKLDSNTLIFITIGVLSIVLVSLKILINLN